MRVVYSVLCVARVEVRGVSTVRREVYGAACCVCCGMLQCRIISTHSCRADKRVQARELDLNWIGTATRNRIAKDTACRHQASYKSVVPGLMFNSKNCRKRIPTSEGLLGTPRGKKKTFDDLQRGSLSDKTTAYPSIRKAKFP